jgi:hypothetical protein
MSGLMNSSASATSPVGRNSPVKRSMVRRFASVVALLVEPDPAEVTGLALVPAASSPSDPQAVRVSAASAATTTASLLV